MKAVFSSVVLVTYKALRSHNAKDHNRHLWCRENLSSLKLNLLCITPHVITDTSKRGFTLKVYLIQSTLPNPI
jgi:hypothetical protein